MAQIAPNHAKGGYDAVIVGSGASGGMAAYVLTKAGLKVLMLEAGRDYDPLTETPMFNVPTDAPLRGAGTPDKEFGYWDATVSGGWTVPGEPYTVAEGSKFKWWRTRMLGGRTNHWTRLSFRFGPFDFKGRSRDGMGFDWPITYDEIAPYYDKVERMIGVFGAAEGIENSPDSPAGILQPPPKFRSYEAWMQRSMGRTHNMPVVPAHVAILTVAKPEQDRQACFYATDCTRGCQIKANFQTTTVLLPPARKTGGLEVRTGAMVYQVVTDAQGRANGVRYIDKASGRHEEVHARAVVLGASACESARILLQSGPKGETAGLANSSGQVGRNLTDTVATVVKAVVPQLTGLPSFNDEGVTMPHAYVPWWLTREQKAGKLGFARGYHTEMGGGRMMPDADVLMDGARLSSTVGAALHDDMRRYYGSIVSLNGRGEMLPNANSFCELDPKVKDKFGLPVLRFNFAWGDEEKKQAEHQRRTYASVFEAMGAKILTDMSQPIEEAMSTGGGIIHELGTARMGANARDSVVNHECEAWDVPGLFVVDGATFASNPDKNPTLTIMALTWRAMDRLVARLGRAS
jgi:choline dehydrogenase-like flavoprotein